MLKQREVPVTQSKVSFGSSKALLEGILAIPKELPHPFPGVVVCHGDSLLGGNMNSPVVQAVCLSLNDSGIATLRFNFRGAGASTGQFDGGRGEQDDARAAVSLLKNFPGVHARRLGIVGYSFGAAVALRMARKERSMQGVIGISPPLPALDHPDIDSYQRPRLLLIREDDPLTSADRLSEKAASLTSPPSVLRIPKANRTWDGSETRLGENVAEFFSRLFNL